MIYLLQLAGFGSLAVRTRLDRDEGRYHGQFYVDVAELVQQVEHFIKRDPFEQEVLQTIGRLTVEGN